MKISFDLDDTLIPSQKEDFETEKRNVLQVVTGVELIRKGTRAIITELRGAGHEVGVYTSSHRGLGRIRFQFWTYGIRCDFLVNEKRSRKELQALGISCSKYPPAFDIDLHIDDALGVQLEGQKYGFEVIVLKKDDVDWCCRISSRVNI